MVMELHVHALAAEANAFHFEPHALLMGHFALEADLAARAHDALPGKGVTGAPEKLDHLPVVERIAGGGRHLGIGRDLAARDRLDDLADSAIPLLGQPGAEKAPRDVPGVWPGPHGYQHSEYDSPAAHLLNRGGVF